MKVSLLITIAVIAVPFLVVGIRGFKTQRPFLISLRWVSRTALVFSVSLFLAAVMPLYCVFPYLIPLRVYPEAYLPSFYPPAAF